MTYRELVKLFREHEKNRPLLHLTAHIVFTADSFRDNYTKEQRTYVVSSNNKAYQQGHNGYSIFGSCLDGTDCNVRLDAYMRDEKGGKNGWKVEECYLTDTLSDKKSNVST